MPKETRFKHQPEGNLGFPLVLKLWPLWIVTVLWCYLKAHPLPLVAFQTVPAFGAFWADATVRHTKLILGALFLGGLSTLVGRGVLIKCGWKKEWAPAEEACLSFGLGVGILGCLYFFMALTHSVSPAWVFSVMGILSIGGLVANRRSLLSGFPNLRPDFESHTLVSSGIPLFMILAGLALGGIQALSGETFYDSLVYHLALPNLYRLTGGFIATPESMYSGIPMLVEMFYSWSFYFHPGSLGPLMSWMTFAACACCLVQIGRRIHSMSAGYWAAAVFLTAPFIVDASHRSGVEGASTLWLLCALIVLLAIKDYQNPEVGLMALSGAFTGFAMSAKYTNWPLALVICAALRANGMPWRFVGRMVLAAAIVLAPWILKNFIFYGNPLFPFADDLFRFSGREPVDWRALHADARGRDWLEIFSSGRAALDVIAHPWRSTMSGKTTDDTVGPAFLMLIPFLLLWKNQNNGSRLVILTAFGAWLSWWPFSGLTRFFIPGLSLVAVICAASAVSLPGKHRYGVLALLTFACVFNLTDSAAFALRLGSLREIAGKETPEQHLLRGRPGYPAPNFGALDWINHNTPPTSKILVVGDGRTFYLQRRFVPNSLIDQPVFFTHLGASRSAAELSSSLRARELTHLAVNMSLLARTRPPKGVGDGVAGDVLEEFLLRYADLVFEERDLPTERWNLVYELRSEPLAKSVRQSDIFLTWFRRPRSS